MNKVKSMLRPSDFWHIGEHESWFSDMAQEGFHLKKVGIQFVKFTIGDPKQIKYRIDLSQGKILMPEQKKCIRKVAGTMFHCSRRQLLSV